MKERPVYLDLTQIKLPITALCSIIHRISGILMILSLPVLAALMVLLFRHEAGFDHWQWLVTSMVMKAMYLGMLWAWSYHVIAGLKHMVHDFFRVSFAQGSEDDIDVFFGSLCTGCSVLGICYRLVLR